MIDDKKIIKKHFEIKSIETIFGGNKWATIETLKKAKNIGGLKVTFGMVQGEDFGLCLYYWY